MGSPFCLHFTHLFLHNMIYLIVVSYILSQIFPSSLCFYAAVWIKIRHKGTNSKLISCLGLWRKG